MKNGKYCKATSKRTGNPCRAWALKGNDLCRHHGGRSLKGAANPQFKHGRDSKYTVVRLQDSYARNINDETILNLQSEIAMLRSLVQETIDEADALVTVTEVDRAAKQVRRVIYRDPPDMQAIEAALMELFEVIAEAKRQSQNREQIAKMAERVGRMVHREHQHRIDQRMAITQEQLANHVAAIAGILTQRIKDRRLLNEITSDLFALDAELVGDGREQGTPNGHLLPLGER